MKESVQTALSWVRSHASELGIRPDFWEHSDIHVHVPAGAIPKDGPSAGVTMVTALVSLLTRRPVRAQLAMTGEITLSGRVLPVGGIKEKVLAARRAGVRTIILPSRNEKNLLEDVPDGGAPGHDLPPGGLDRPGPPARPGGLPAAWTRLTGLAELVGSQQLRGDPTRSPSNRRWGESS